VGVLEETYKGGRPTWSRSIPSRAAPLRNGGQVLAIVAPGQGSQVPGFLAPWLELPSVAHRLRWLAACSGLDLEYFGTQADAETIRDTAVAQPLIVAAGLLPLLELFPHPTEAFGLVGVGAGHSVGELTAAAAAHVISAEQAMVLVRERGRAMAEAAAVTPTGMTAVLGGDRDAVLAKLAEHGLVAANQNGAGQIVAGGTLDQLAALQADPPEGARLRPLEVAGAFHTEHMAPAVGRLRALDLQKAPSISETLDWARALALLGAGTLDARLVQDTLSLVLKHEADVERVRGKLREIAGA